MKSITLVAIEVWSKAQYMQAGHRRPQPGSKRAGRDGGHDIAVVDDGGDVGRARPRQFNRHAGRARNCQARRLRQLRCRIPQPAQACPLPALHWTWGRHDLQASESFLQKRPGSSSCTPEQTPMADNGLAHASNTHLKHWTERAQRTPASRPGLAYIIVRSAAAPAPREWPTMRSRNVGCFASATLSGSTVSCRIHRAAASIPK